MDRLTREDVRRLCGDVTDDRAARMVATGASVRDLEVALAWSAGESDVMGEARQPLSGRAAELYELLPSALDDEEADPSRPA